MPKKDDATQPPGPHGGLPYLGHAFQAGRDPLGFFGAASKKHGDIVHFNFGAYVYVMINSASAIKHVLVDNHRNYVKGLGYRGLKFVLGEGLITSEGDVWRRQRKLAQPAFHRDRLTDFARWMTDATSDMLARWDARAALSSAKANGAHEATARDVPTVDVHGEMMRVTLDIVGRTLLSQSLDERAEGIEDAMAVTVRCAADYVASPLSLPLWFPSPGNIRFRRAKRTLDALALDIIAERRKKPVPKSDLLSMLMDARDEETREAMTDRQLKDELLTIVTAGHETTANAMTWTLYLLSKHPDVARRVESEVASVLGTRTPALEDLARMPYGLAVIQESMRLYPPVWGFERRALEDDEIGGYRIAKGTQVAIFPYVLHRHPAHWQNPEGFDPERFLSGPERPRYAYLPFGGGPRICIGNAFAMMEAQILLSMIASRYRFELPAGARVELEPVVTLRPRHGMPMILTPKRSSAEGGALEDLLLDRGEGGRRPYGVERGGAKPPVALGQRH